ncbi:MAG: rRNA (guanine-N2)-methyltransferase [Anaerolineaceae bacterium]|nr:rRNA (guanine-N2)-methyltransferase [Anaerolineaceae bacterium]
MFDIYFVTPPGLEVLTRQEIDQIIHQYQLVITNFHPEKLELSCDLRSLYIFNLTIRTANRILVRTNTFKATNFGELVDKSSKFNWEIYIQPETKVKIRTTCKKSRLYHSDAVTERIIQGLKKRLGFEPNAVSTKQDDPDNNEQLIVVRFFRDICTISLDSSGAPLHQRGYRTHTHKAPIRENLAAAMLLSMSWDGKTPLVDPFCGSGTIPIEAAYLAQNIPPGINRHFQFMAWRDYQEKTFTEVKDLLTTAIRKRPLQIIGSDRNAGAIQIARQNITDTPVSKDVLWFEHAVSNMEIPEQPGMIITNPPYGLRINTNKDIRNLYAQFGNVLRERCEGWQVLFLCNDLKLATQTKLPIKKIIGFSNGGIPVSGYYAKI